MQQDAQQDFVHPSRNSFHTCKVLSLQLTSASRMNTGGRGNSAAYTSSTCLVVHPKDRSCIWPCAAAAAAPEAAAAAVAAARLLAVASSSGSLCCASSMFLSISRVTCVQTQQQ
jgi:hypothetical protein